MLFLSMTKISRFANDAAGLEKTLRFLQSFVQVIAAYSASVADAAPWLQARNQFALGRRYLRFFKFVDAFNLAFKGMNSSTGIVALLETGKWSCLGMYLLLECFTIMDAMGVWSTEWAPKLFVEAMKFWFYSISFSIILSFVLLYFELSKSTMPPKREQGKSEKIDAQVDRGATETKQRSSLRKGLMKKLVIDCCDIFIPGFTTGWLIVSSGTVGILGIISTVLGSLDIWDRLQRLS